MTEPGAHAPSPPHALKGSQSQSELQARERVPQLPHASACDAPASHTPWSVHSGGPHAPAALHVCRSVPHLLHAPSALTIPGVQVVLGASGVASIVASSSASLIASGKVVVSSFASEPTFASVKNEASGPATCSPS